MTTVWPFTAATQDQLIWILLLIVVADLPIVDPNDVDPGEIMMALVLIGLILAADFGLWCLVHAGAMKQPKKGLRYVPAVH